jgi:hypothetical protein
VEEERFFASVGWKTRTTLLLKNSEEEKRKDSVELNRARLVLQLLGRRGGAYRLGRRVGRRVIGYWSGKTTEKSQPTITKNKKEAKRTHQYTTVVHTVDLEGKEKKSEERTEYVCLLPEGQYKICQKRKLALLTKVTVCGTVPG